MELIHTSRWQRLRELLVQMLEARANRYSLLPRTTKKAKAETPSS